MMTIADEVDSQLSQAMDSYTENLFSKSRPLSGVVARSVMQLFRAMMPIMIHGMMP
jgi:hypothetical protein